MSEHLIRQTNKNGVKVYVDYGDYTQVGKWHFIFAGLNMVYVTLILAFVIYGMTEVYSLILLLYVAVNVSSVGVVTSIPYPVEIKTPPDEDDFNPFWR